MPSNGRRQHILAGPTGIHLGETEIKIWNAFGKVDLTQVIMFISFVLNSWHKMSTILVIEIVLQKLYMHHLTQCRITVKCTLGDICKRRLIQNLKHSFNSTASILAANVSNLLILCTNAGNITGKSLLKCGAWITRTPCNRKTACKCYLESGKSFDLNAQTFNGSWEPVDITNHGFKSNVLWNIFCGKKPLLSQRPTNAQVYRLYTHPRW